MEKRFLAWLAVSLAIFMLYAEWFLPKPPKPVRRPGEAQQAAGDADIRVPEDTEPVHGGGAAPSKEPTSRPETDRADSGIVAEQDLGHPPEPRLAPEADPPVELISLGSVEPGGPYRMLATLTNQGAAVQRLELSSRKFRDLHDRSGYLGHLAWKDAQGGGAEARVVGRGTPAAIAGLAPDDVITAVGDIAIETSNDLTSALKKTKPKHEIVLTVRRKQGTIQKLNVTLGRRPLEVMRPEIENLIAREEALPADFADPASFLLSMTQFDDRKAESDQLDLPGTTLRTGRWQIAPDPDESSITFTKQLPQFRLEFRKRFSLVPVPEEKRTDRDYPAYHLILEITVRNQNDRPCKVAYSLDGPTGLPTEGWWYANRINRGSGVAGLRDVVTHFDGQSPDQISASQIADQGTLDLKGSAVGYIGVDAQYFSTVLLPRKASLDQMWFEKPEAIRIDPKIEPKKRKQIYTNVTCRLHRNPIDLEPGAERFDRYTIFCGPKRPSLLAKYKACDRPDYSLEDLVYYGWPIWGGVARVMSGILHTFYGMVGNYAIAIVMLTIVVRGCMFPLSRKQALNMAKMQELKPEMDRINEKYKKDLEKRTKAQQELWRKHNYNPMGGCLLAFVQLPIFFGLYRALMIDVELRQAPLLTESIRWCSNLSAPDMLWDWSGVMPAFIQGWLGPYFNLLPIATIGLFIMQQKLFMPPAMTEQAQMQQKMMTFMMIFMGVLFFKVASGLCLYFIASSLWGIAERKLLPKMTPPSPGVPSVSTTANSKEKAAETRPKKVTPANRKR
ncbi:MAG: YidC/Oxa1 family insertase periplasmic-domain containing protein [Pirellulales bacterium]|nr:YidC/Oxa1 family insertase periplasmic-domain containing protein [Pirellulales bacterium]